MVDGISKPRADYLASDFRRGFIKHCGFEAEEIRRGYFRSKVNIGQQHCQQDGFIHAGVMATMADHTAGYAAFTTVEEGFQILTIEFKINFLRPAFGEQLICEARVIREGGQIIVAESEVVDFSGSRARPVAKALVTLMAVPKQKLEGITSVHE
ncbi:MAG: PaaI family thioesterase [Deltaproteobacteria bacterium]|nr:PaaI family thioesterase [Deltaproteobacteria bacterium]MBW1928731.1 PaaI family thioesterase [Deltaproteobacteria bacterium]MBW2024476.1 PaaI family thioesterase [Deltaproteobacteria bacterium]MBW2124103.1 PaaI family thioesterase [Deltaproteobacteria bacterium]RLB22906.1 MAG: PaaI family thioesterase [Deltaproteobacteria bacterium]